MSRIDSKEMKTIVVLAIEHTLLKIGKKTLEKVQEEMHHRYKCNISDCYEHPEYLNKILKDLFGDLYHEVVRDIKSTLTSLHTKNQSPNF
jgi:hypothetical protein